MPERWDLPDGAIIRYRGQELVIGEDGDLTGPLPPGTEVEYNDNVGTIGQGGLIMPATLRKASSVSGEDALEIAFAAAENTGRVVLGEDDTDQIRKSSRDGRKWHTDDDGGLILR
jgi:hypothetical protein